MICMWMTEKQESEKIRTCIAAGRNAPAVQNEEQLAVPESMPIFRIYSSTMPPFVVEFDQLVVCIWHMQMAEQR